MTNNPEKIGTDLIWFEKWLDGKYYLETDDTKSNYTMEEIQQLKKEIERYEIEKLDHSVEDDYSFGADGCYDGE